MEKFIRIITALLFAAVLVGVIIQCQTAKKSGEMKNPILTVLPLESDLGDWNADGEPQTAEGDDLFLLINGGAEIYYEYGFKRAVIHSYTLGDTLSLNIEIYEMEDSAAAYGAFSFKSGLNAEQVAIGDECRMDDYYLNFWKGNYVVTVIGFDTSLKTRSSLSEIAGMVEKRIPESAERPPLVEKMVFSDDQPARITYIEGNLGVYNRYEFDTRNIFGVTEGVISEFLGWTEFVFKYNNSEDCFKWFENAKTIIRENGKFTAFSADAFEFTFIDRANIKFQVVRKEMTILIINKEKL